MTISATIKLSFFTLQRAGQLQNICGLMLAICSEQFIEDWLAPGCEPCSVQQSNASIQSVIHTNRVHCIQTQTVPELKLL